MPGSQYQTQAFLLPATRGLWGPLQPLKYPYVQPCASGRGRGVPTANVLLPSMARSSQVGDGTEPFHVARSLGHRTLHSYHLLVSSSCHRAKDGSWHWVGAEGVLRWGCSEGLEESRGGWAAHPGPLPSEPPSIQPTQQHRTLSKQGRPSPPLCSIRHTQAFL